MMGNDLVNTVNNVKAIGEQQYQEFVENHLEKKNCFTLQNHQEE